MLYIHNLLLLWYINLLLSDVCVWKFVHVYLSEWFEVVCYNVISLHHYGRFMISELVYFHKLIFALSSWYYFLRFFQMNSELWFRANWTQRIYHFYYTFAGLFFVWGIGSSNVFGRLWVVWVVLQRTQLMLWSYYLISAGVVVFYYVLKFQLFAILGNLDCTWRTIWLISRRGVKIKLFMFRLL